MKRPLLLVFALHALLTSAQWELVTPIKTRSEFTALHMVNDAAGFAVDNPMGAILRTHDGGFHWERMVNSLSNNPIGMHVWDDQRAIVVGESGSVYRTTDAFTTIIGSNNPLYGTFQCVHFVNDTLGWAGTQAGRIYRSIDAGATWTLMQSGLSTNTLVLRIQFIDELVGYASCSGSSRVIKSTDGGLTWQDQSPNMLASFRGMHWYDVLTGVCVGSAGRIARTTDGGVTWDSIPIATTYTMNDLAAQGNVLVACGAWGRTIRSTDAGLSWSEIQIGNTEHRSVSLLPSGEGVMGTDGRIMGSHDMGQSWALRHEGVWHTRLNKVSFMDADTGVAVGYQTTGGFEGGLLRTTDGGRRWTKAGTGGLGVHINPAGQGCLGGGSGAFAKTTNGFFTRTPGSGPNVAIRCTWALDANTLFVAGGAVFGGIYRSTNGGSSWTKVLDVGNITISDLWFTNDQNGYAVGEYGDNYRTTDGGATWEPMTGTPGGHTVFFLDEDHGWMKYRRTVDGGATWTDIDSPQQTMSMFFTDPDTGYAVSYSGYAVKSVDGGENWTTILPDILNASIGDASWVDGAIVMVANNGDIYRAQVACPGVAATPVINMLGDQLCTGASGTVQWYWNDEPVGGDGPCLLPPGTGTYHVVVTDELGCSSAASAPVQVVNTEAMEPTPLSDIRILPNPTTGRVRLAGLDGPGTILVLDMQGRAVRSFTISTSDPSVDLSDLRTGTYLVRVTGAHGATVVRLVKE
ncbi:MAG: T9SS type A sorting domain-containing protein [Flavobacteriales bacterium]